MTFDAATRPPSSDARPTVPAVLTLGFGATVAMWAIGYVGRLPGVEAPPAALGLGFVACFLAAGFVAARRLNGLAAAAAVGAVAGLLDLLIIASIKDLREHMGALVAPGTVAAGALLGVLGGLAGRTSAIEPEAPAIDWVARFGRVALAVTLLLLGVGGAVTSHDAGLAVPDWPNTYGTNMFLFPLEKMTGGIYYEHTHRLIGSLVGLTTLTFMALILRFDARRWVKGLAVLAFVLVCVQGVLGGLRVTGKPTLSTEAADLSPQLALAVVHGVTAQVFFGLLAVLAAATSVTWRTAPGPQPRESGETDLQLATWLVPAVLLQLVLGAFLRHYHSDPTWHITMAVVVVTLGGFAGVRAWGYHGDLPALRRAGLGLTHLLGLQLLLGIGALIVTTVERPAGQRVTLEVPIATAHQTTGAMILVAAVLVRLWLGRLVAPKPEPAAKAPVAAG